MREPNAPSQPPFGLLRAILLDLDGTVADSHGLIMTCYNHAIRAHLGREGLREIWLQRVGLPLDDILIATYEHYGVPHTPELMTEVKQTYRVHMWEHVETVEAFPGMIDALHALKAKGLRLAIVTTKHRMMALRHLETLQIRSLFDVVVAGDDCHHYKPHPEPFLKALELLEVAPNTAAHVGDSRYDVLGAQAAGVFTIAACWGTDDRAGLLAAHPDFVLETPQELEGLIPAEV